MKVVTLCFFFIFSGIFIFQKVDIVNASEIDAYSVDYHAEYYPQESGKTDVLLTIQITSIRSDIVVKQFGLSFPKSFPIENIRVLSDATITPQIKSNDGEEIMFQLPENLQSKDKKLTIRLEYSQKNTFKKTNSVYEFIAPTIPSKQNVHFSARLHIPEFVTNKPSLSKPTPTKIEDKTMSWDTVTTDTMYVLFGASQSYKLQLKYHLKNDSFSRKKFDITLPPETLYQKIFIESIEPHPESVYIDEDGNFMATYTLNPHATKTIIFTGFSQLFIKPQEDMKPFVKETIKNQKKYLTYKTFYWNLGDLENDKLVKNLTNLADIYKAVVLTLNYRYEKIKDKKRLGAREALLQSQNSVCTEYSDLFIALARRSNIFSREVEGYGYSSDSKLHPLSLAKDVLHAWVEYFDTKSNLWIPIDPTWEDTSKIDYFNGFDINHIVFAIHGKSDTHPYPAGMYKITNTKDVLIEPVDTPPRLQQNIFLDTTIPKTLVKDRSYSIKVTLQNRGQTFVKNKKLIIKSDTVTFSQSQFSILLLAPMEEKTFDVVIAPQKSISVAKISFFIDQEPLQQKTMIVQSSKTQLIITIIGIAVGLLIIVPLLLLKGMKKL